jgi:3-oxoacyl-[acyl-carrier protein] reductase
MPTPTGLHWKVALVTGGSGGIGRAISLALAAEGAAVAIAYEKRAAVAEQLVNEITSGGGRAIALKADLRGVTAPHTLISEVESSLGPVDVLVSNAGIGRRLALEEVTEQDFDETLAVNLRAPFLLAQRVVPKMRERRFGRILFVSSVAAFTGGIVGPHYAASKAGLHGLTHFLASRLVPTGITVNAIAPALIGETGMLPGNPEELRQQVPMRRLGKPEEVAELAIAILRNPYLTNQVLSLDGGMYPR